MPHFTKENARENAAKGNAKRWDNYRQAIARGELPKKKIKPEPAPEPEPPQPIAIQPAMPPLEFEKFPLSQLGRVRKHLGRLNNLLDHETDPQKLDRLASATAKLCEVERILAGRPLPGSHRPKSGGSSRGTGNRAEPIAEG